MSSTRNCSRCGGLLAANARNGVCWPCFGKEMAAELPVAEGPTEAATPDNRPQFTVAENPIEESVGQTIGRYKLVGRLGEGGCGVVYVAEQTEPVRRRVALKLIKLGMDTKAVVARFEGERQALAMMDHPNIARVFDAGTSATGRPYFIMELVQGVRITDYCDQHTLSTRERIELFILVCQAIQHAHQKGVIHRDIKPSNILVTGHDGGAVPKVIDFGIAKAIEGRLTEHTVHTQMHHFLGTPAYMSPEQAELTGRDIDTRSDIYSLGVLLYELLAGRTPFDARELMAAGLDAMRKVIREREPVRPSNRFGALAGEESTTTAQSRGTDPARLRHQIQGDLDWIVMKCLEKDRNRRYETANGLAADLRRHLANEPVIARPPGRRYRLLKMVRRNKTTANFIALLAGVLVAATGISTWLAIRATLAEALAKQRLAESQAISRFMTGMIQRPDPTRNGRSITVAETLDRAVSNMDRDVPDHPVLRANIQTLLASSYCDLGLFREAIPLQEKVRDYNLKVHGWANNGTLRGMSHLAASYERVGRRDEALKLREEILRFRLILFGPADPETFAAMNDLALSDDDVGREAEARKVREDLLWRLRKAISPDHITLAVMNTLAATLAMTDPATSWNKTNAVQLAEAAVAATARKNPDYLNTLAAAYAQTEQFDRAQTVEREAMGLVTTEADKQDCGSRWQLYQAHKPYREAKKNMMN